jgi:SAM-dependent methyltransferase
MANTVAAGSGVGLVTGILFNMPLDQDIVKNWRASAPFWEKHRETIRQMFVPVTEALIDAAQIRSGNAVLDIATGPGEPALTIAALVGPQGSVFGIDPAPEMVEGARRAATRLDVKNVRFEIASADSLPMSDDTFDAAVSRYGVMFFPSPVEGIRETLRVLKPGRKLAFAVWSAADKNPFHYELARVMERFVDTPPPDPDAPDAFRFAAPGKLRGVFAEAGVVDPKERVLQFEIQAPISVEDFWHLRTTLSEKLRDKLATLSAETLAEVKRQAQDAMRPYATTSGIRFPAEVRIVSGSKKKAN